MAINAKHILVVWKIVRTQIEQERAVGGVCSSEYRVCREYYRHGYSYVQPLPIGASAEDAEQKHTYYARREDGVERKECA